MPVITKVIDRSRKSGTLISSEAFRRSSWKFEIGSLNGDGSCIIVEEFSFCLV